MSMNGSSIVPGNSRHNVSQSRQVCGVLHNKTELKRILFGRLRSFVKLVVTSKNNSRFIHGDGATSVFISSFRLHELHQKFHLNKQIHFILYPNGINFILTS